MMKLINAQEKESRTFGAIVAWFATAIAFFIGVFEGYYGVAMYGIDVLLAIVGLAILGGSWVYFYYKGKHSVAEKQSLVFAGMLGIIVFYAVFDSIVIGALMVVPYFVGKWLEERK